LSIECYKQSVKEKNKDTKYITTYKVLFSPSSATGALASLSRSEMLRSNTQARGVYGHLTLQKTGSAKKPSSGRSLESCEEFSIWCRIES